MTSLFTVRRRAEEFAIAIDGGSVDGSLDAGTHAADLSEFIGIVSMLREHETAPRTEFVDNLRNLLLVEAQTALAPQPADPLLPRRQAWCPRAPSRCCSLRRSAHRGYDDHGSRRPERTPG